MFLNSQTEQQKWIRFTFKDDSEVENFNLNVEHCENRIKDEDQVQIIVQEGVLFVKNVIAKVLNGPFKFLSTIRFTLPYGQELDIRYISDRFIQIEFIGQFEEESYQLFEELINYMSTQAGQSQMLRELNTQSCRMQLEIVYNTSISLDYNSIAMSKLGEICNLRLLSIIFGTSPEMKREWKQQIFQNLSFVRTERLTISTISSLSEKDLLTLLNKQQNMKGFVIQSSNIIIKSKEMSLIEGKKDLSDKIKKDFLINCQKKRQVHLDILDPELLKLTSFIDQIKIQAAISDELYLQCADTTFIGKVVPVILKNLPKRSQSIKFSSSSLEMSFSPLKKLLYLSFQETTNESSTVQQQINYSFCLQFIDHFRSFTTSLHVVLENISFRHTNQYLYSQIIDSARMAKKITCFILEAPLQLIKCDFKLSTLYDESILKIKLLSLQKGNSAQNQQGNCQMKQKSLNYYRKEQYEWIISEMELLEQTYHLSYLIQILPKYINKNQNNTSDNIKINNYLSIDAMEKRSKNLLKSYQNINLRINPQRTSSSLIFEYEKSFQMTSEKQQIQNEDFKQFNRSSSQQQNQQSNTFISQSEKDQILSEKRQRGQMISKIKLDLGFDYPDLIKQLIQTSSLNKVHELHLCLSKDIKSELLNKVISFYTKTNFMNTLYLKLANGWLSYQITPLKNFVESNSKSLKNIKVILEQNKFNDIVLKESIMQDYFNLIPFQSSQMMKGQLVFKGQDAQINGKLFMQSFQRVGNNSQIEITTPSFQISKDSHNNIMMAVDTQKQEDLDLFLYFLDFNKIYHELKIITLTATITIQHYQPFFRFVISFSKQIKNLECLFIDLCQDQNKLETQESYTKILREYEQFDSLSLKFRDQLSKQDAFSIRFQKTEKLLSIYFQGNQIFSQNYNYDRLLQATFNSFFQFVSHEAISLSIELYFDGKIRFNSNLPCLRVFQEGILQNKRELSKFTAVVKVIDVFGRIETHHMFSEIVRSVNTKKKLISKLVLIYRSMINSHAVTEFRREILWDTISVITIGSIQSKITPKLRQMFFVNDENIKDSPRRVEIEGDFNILQLFQQERDSGISQNHQIIPISSSLQQQFSVESLLQRNQSDLNQENEIFDFEFNQ